MLLKKTQTTQETAGIAVAISGKMGIYGSQKHTKPTLIPGNGVVCYKCCCFFFFFYIFPSIQLTQLLMTTFLFTAVWRWECTSNPLRPRKWETHGVFASIILFLTQRPFSAAVVRFGNSRRMSGAGRKNSPLACSNANCVYELSKGPLSCPWCMTVSVYMATRGEKP